MIASECNNGVKVGEDRTLVFTAEYRLQVLEAAKAGHDELHDALTRGGGGFVQHSTNPNCVLMFIGTQLWVAASAFIYTGDCLSVNYG